MTWRELIADKVMDLANLVAAALVFGQWLTRSIQFDAFLLGASFYVFSLVVSYHLSRRK